MNPKVFISHASEDKSRFVLRFAERLRSSGIDAWLDRWEMFPGDSLVDKIFEEGLRNAAAVIVVLSANSIEKPWVREELNAAVVKRINAGTKLIPVVLDSCSVPAALESTLWESIADLNSYDANYERILAAVSGIRDKPPLGMLPGYATSPIKEIGGLARIDNLVLKTVCEIALESNSVVVDGSQTQSSPELIGISEQELDDAIEILEREGLVSAIRTLGPGLPHVNITTYGFQQYAQAYIEGYAQKVQEIAAAIVNLQLQDNLALVEKFCEKQFFIDHVLDVLALQQYISLSKAIGGHIWIVDVSATLRRALS